MPRELVQKKRGIDSRTRRLIIGIIALIIIIIVVIWFRLERLKLNGDFTPTEPIPGLAALETMQVTVTVETITTTPNPTDVPATETQLPSTPTQEDPLLALDTPIGDDFQFIIHRVSEGETLQIFANQYNTTVEAITSVNYDLIVPLWTNWLVIIPLNNTDVNNLPVFEAHRVEEDNIPLRDLAEQLSASLDEMIRFNNLDANHILHRGEWLLVPRERP